MCVCVPGGQQGLPRTPVTSRLSSTPKQCNREIQVGLRVVLLTELEAGPEPSRRRK